MLTSWSGPGNHVRLWRHWTCTYRGVERVFWQRSIDTRKQHIMSASIEARVNEKPPHGARPPIESARNALHATPVWPFIAVRPGVADRIAALSSLAAQSKDRLQIHRCECFAGLESRPPPVPRRSRGYLALRDPKQARLKRPGASLAKSPSKRLTRSRPL